MAIGFQPIERAIAESFSFQRPSAIGDNFRMLDQKLDIGGVMRKPYRRRKTSLFDSIEQLVQDRNAFVHSGQINTNIFDAQINSIISDLEIAVNRAYEAIANQYHFVPSHDY